MYIPGANAVDDPAIVLRLLRASAVGHLVNVGDGGAFDATVLPFLVDDEMTIVRVHLARANPQWRSLDGAHALMVVPVTDAYVSPAWYPSKVDEPRVVPTWNYEVVHVHGTVRVRDDSGFVERVVRDLTDRHETARREWDATPVWSVDDAPADFVARQLRAIVGIEMIVDRIDAKRKLSQNRAVGDQAGVLASLAGSERARDRAVADAMGASGGT